MAAEGARARNVFAFPTLLTARVASSRYAAGVSRTNDEIPAGRRPPSPRQPTRCSDRPAATAPSAVAPVRLSLSSL
jgi:hypothetical protein